MKNKYIAAFLLISLLVGLFAAGIYTLKASKPSIKTTKSKKDYKIIGGETDEHGCLIAAGFTWCLEKQKCLRSWEEPCDQEQAFFFLADLKNSLDINFSGITNVNFEWRLNDESGATIKKISLAGKAIDASNIEDVQRNSIDNYFSSQGFEINLGNVVDGTISGTIGYQKNEIVCLVSSYMNVSNFENEAPFQNSSEDVKIACGELE